MRRLWVLAQRACKQSARRPRAPAVASRDASAPLGKPPAPTFMVAGQLSTICRTSLNTESLRRVERVQHERQPAGPGGWRQAHEGSGGSGGSDSNPWATGPRPRTLCGIECSPAQPAAAQAALPRRRPAGRPAAASAALHAAWITACGPAPPHGSRSFKRAHTAQVRSAAARCSA